MMKEEMLCSLGYLIFLIIGIIVSIISLKEYDKGEYIHIKIRTYGGIFLLSLGVLYNYFKLNFMDNISGLLVNVLLLGICLYFKYLDPGKEFYNKRRKMVNICLVIFGLNVIVKLFSILF